MKNLPTTLTNIVSVSLSQTLFFKSSASVQKATAIIGLGVSIISILGVTAMAQVIATLPLSDNAYERLTFPGSVDGNEVQSSWAQSQSGKTEFCLEASTNVSWWKGIKVFDSQNRNIGLMVTQDDSRLNCMTFDNSQLVGGKLEFWKAKGFGVHTYVETLAINHNNINGKKVTIHWVNE